MSVVFPRYGIKSETEKDGFFEGDTAANIFENIVEITLDVDCTQLPYDFTKTFCAEYGVYIDIRLNRKIEGALSRVLYNPFWSAPSFERDMTKILDNVQNMLLKTNDGYIAVLPICISDYCAVVIHSDDSDAVRIGVSPNYEGVFQLNGVAAILAKDNNPYKAVYAAYEYAYNRGYIKTPLKYKKHLPDIYKGLGWCTWNACYHGVSEKLIFEKMEEFNSKNIPIKWIMIDDGWSKISKKNNFQISSFYEDSAKFPNGLKGCIDRLKKEYNVEAVGVWHSLTGYWYGVEKESELFQSQKDNLAETNSGWYIPDGSKAYRFFHTWHLYLKEQGVDFVKIDTQGNTFEFLRGEKDCIKKCIEIQMAADRSAYEVFGDNVINCMGMSNLNAHYRPYTAVSRSSDDFYPEKPESFSSHIIQNVYNSVFLDHLFFCDFDMWWTSGEVAKQSCILRAISGGPVYVSDKIGETNEKYLKALLDSKGNLTLCNHAALPVEDCLFENPVGEVLKLYNRTDSKCIVAVFNLSEQEKSFDLEASDFQLESIKTVYYPLEEKMVDIEMLKNSYIEPYGVRIYVAENGNYN